MRFICSKEELDQSIRLFEETLETVNSKNNAIEKLIEELASIWKDSKYKENKETLESINSGINQITQKMEQDVKEDIMKNYSNRIEEYSNS